MKPSFMCSVTYEVSAAHNSPGGWLTPPAPFDPDVGQRSFDDFLDWARLADELGFDWVSLSEHHFTPLILTLDGTCCRCPQPGREARVSASPTPTRYFEYLQARSVSESSVSLTARQVARAVCHATC